MRYGGRDVIMNILICVGSIAARGGTERIVSNLSNILISKGIDVTILSLCSSPKQRSYYDLDPQVKIIHTNLPKNKYCHIFYMPKIISVIRKSIFDYGIKLCIGTDWHSDLLFWLSCIKCKIVGWEHFSYRGKSLKAKLVSKLFFKRLYKICCLTNSETLRYINGITIPNCNSFEIGDKKYDSTSKRIVALARLSPEKGIDMLLQAAVLVKAKHPDWHLDIYGDGVEKDKLQSMILQLGIHDFVAINDFVSDVKTVLENSSFYVMSSLNEGLPMVLLEAQCCGLPMISFDCQTGPGEIITDGVNGYLVPPGNIKMLAEKINYLIENPEKRLEMSINSRKNAKNYTPGKVAEKWIELFKSLGK